MNRGISLKKIDLNTRRFQATDSLVMPMQWSTLELRHNLTSLGMPTRLAYIYGRGVEIELRVQFDG